MSFSLRSMFGKEGTTPPAAGSPTLSMETASAQVPPGSFAGSPAPAGSPSPAGGPLFRTLFEETDSAFEVPPANAPAAGAPLTVADLLPQLPPELARAGSVPPGEPVRIAPAILSQALSSGQLAVPIFEVFRVCPGIFQSAVAPDDPRLVGLPPAKLPALIQTASVAPPPAPASPFQPLPAVNPPSPAPSPGFSPFAATPASPPASPFASLFAESNQQPPAPVETGRTVTLPPRRDPSQPPATSLPPSTFLDAPSPFTASAPTPASPFSAAPSSTTESAAPALPDQPVSPFTLPSTPAAAVPATPSIGFSLFQEVQPEPPPPPAFVAAGPSAGTQAEPPPSPFLDQPAAAPAKKIFGPATASVASLLQGQSADALGFDPAMVPTWITTQFHGGLVAELQDMPEPMMDLGTIIDGITDIGFRNVLNSARRDHSVPVPLAVLTATGSPASSATTPPKPAAPAPAVSFNQPAPALANPFTLTPAPHPAPEATPNPFKIEPGNPFVGVPDAPPATPTFNPPSAMESVPESVPTPQPAPTPAAFTVVPKPQGPAFIQPKADIDSVLSSVAAPQLPAAAPVTKPEPKIIDPFAPSEAAPAKGGFSSFDLLGGNDESNPPPTPEVTAVETAELPEIPIPAAAPAAPEQPAITLPETPSDSSLPLARPEAESMPLPAARGLIDLPAENPPPAEPFTTAPPSPPMPSATLPPRATPAKSALGVSALEPTGEEQLVLRALLDSDEDLDIQRVLDLTTALPGIAACALIRNDNVFASSSSKGAEAKAFRTQAADVAKNLRALAPLIGIADAETFTLNTDTRLITLCFPGAVTLAVLHDREPTLGQRDKLTLIARQLERLGTGS